MPAENGFLPYGRHLVEEDDISAVVEALRSDWLTTGPRVTQFEEAVSDFCGARCAVAVSSGTAALHAAMHAIGIGPGDEVIVPAITFAASANCVVYQGGTPVFADVQPDSLLVDPAAVERLISPRTKAIVAVDYAGQPCDYDVLRALSDRYDLVLVADACHSIGAEYNGRKVGTLADLTVFSFHPVKHITTGEGGMIVTDDEELAASMRRFRNHGITADHRSRARAGTWSYEMVELGYNYRLSDLQCALGMSQLSKLPTFLRRRRELACRYDREFASIPGVQPLVNRMGEGHAYHLYVVFLKNSSVRANVFSRMLHRGIGVNVHYLPVYLHPFYRNRFGCEKGLCPRAEDAYDKILSLPLWAGMDNTHVERVVHELSTSY